MASKCMSFDPSPELFLWPRPPLHPPQQCLGPGEGKEERGDLLPGGGGAREDGGHHEALGARNTKVLQGNLGPVSAAQ